MNKCVNCGHVFEDWEATERTETLCWLDGSPYQETYECCPYCGKSDIEHDVEECKNCGEYFGWDELYDGICPDCIKAKLNVTNGKAFLIDSDQLVQFMCDEFFNISISGYVKGCGAERLNIALEDYFDRLVFDMGAKQMLEHLNAWIFEDENWGCDMFGGWLKEHE